MHTENMRAFRAKFRVDELNLVPEEWMTFGGGGTSWFSLGGGTVGSRVSYRRIDKSEPHQ